MEQHGHQVVVTSFVDEVGGEVEINVGQEVHSRANNQANRRRDDMTLFIGIKNGIVLQFHGHDDAGKRRSQPKSSDDERRCSHLRFDAGQRFEGKTGPSLGLRRYIRVVGGSKFVSVEMVDVRYIYHYQSHGDYGKTYMQNVDELLAERSAVYITLKQRETVDAGDGKR